MNFRPIIRQIAYGLLALSLWACNGLASSQANQGSGWTQLNFYLRYLEATREVYVEMAIFGDSSALVLPEPPRFNGEPMEAKRLPQAGFQYRITLPKPQADSVYTLRYKDRNGRDYEQTLRMPLCRDFKISSEGGLSKSQGGALSWQGPAFTAADGLVVNFLDSRGMPITMNHVGITPQANIFSLGGNHLGSLEPGPLRLGLTKKHSGHSMQDSTRVTWTTEYYFNPIQTELKP